MFFIVGFPTKEVLMREREREIKRRRHRRDKSLKKRAHEAIEAAKKNPAPKKK